MRKTQSGNDIDGLGSLVIDNKACDVLNSPVSMFHVRGDQSLVRTGGTGIVNTYQITTHVNYPIMTVKQNTLALQLLMLTLTIP